MKNKDNIVMTKDMREAEELLQKLTNKEKANFTEFWKKHENQMRLNKVAIPEFLKQAIRDNNKEMFVFLWEKSKEKNISLGRAITPVKTKNKGLKKDLGKEGGLVSELVLVAVVSNNSRFIDYLSQKIGYKEVINEGITFKTMLEAGKTDMFKALYDKTEDYADKEQAIEFAAKKNNIDALEYCIEKETINGNLNKKLAVAWEKAIESLIRVDNEDAAQKMLLKSKNMLSQQAKERIANVAVRYNKNNIATQCLENRAKDERFDYLKLFKNAVLADNKEMIKILGPEVKKDKQLIHKAVFMKRYQNKDDILKAIMNSTKLKEKDMQELEDKYMITVATGAFLKDEVMPKGGDEFLIIRNAINAEKMKLQEIDLVKHKGRNLENIQIKHDVNNKVRLKKVTKDNPKEKVVLERINKPTEIKKEVEKNKPKFEMGLM